MRYQIERQEKTGTIWECPLVMPRNHSGEIRNEISPALFRESEIWCEIRNEIFKAKFREIRNFLLYF